MRWEVARKPRYLGLVMTLQCPLQCSHCLVDAGPYRTEKIMLTEALHWIKEAATLGMQIVGISGGEPFLLYKELVTLVSKISSLGLKSDVFTSAYWAKTKESAVRLLRGLKGLDCLNISVDIFHQEHVPLQNIRHALIAAKEVGIPNLSIGVCYTREEEKSLVGKLGDSLEGVRINYQPVWPVARAAHEEKICSFPSHRMSIAPCPMNAIAVLPEGDALACCGPVVALQTRKQENPFFLGNLREHSLKEILHKCSEDDLLRILRTWGPWKVALLAAREGLVPFKVFHKVNDDPCFLCYELFSREEIRLLWQRRNNSTLTNPLNRGQDQLVPCLDSLEVF